jgi:hypothetical protein
MKIRVLDGWLQNRTLIQLFIQLCLVAIALPFWLKANLFRIYTLSTG